MGSASLREVDPGLVAAIGQQHQPALVEGTARNADLLALEVGQNLHRRIRLHHQGADIARIRDPGDRDAVIALPADPEPVLDDGVDRIAHQRHVGRIVAAEGLDLEREALALVERVVLDDVELPVHGAELEHADLQRAELGRVRSPGEGKASGTEAERQQCATLH